MSERERPPQITQEHREYSFEDGVTTAIGRITELLNSQDYVVVGIAGPLVDDTNAGKTTLSGTLYSKLAERGIPSVRIDTINEFNKHNKIQMKLDQTYYESTKSVIILGAVTFGFPDFTDNEAEKFKTNQDQKIKKMGEDMELPISKIDIRILIYPANRPIKEVKSKLADISIRNEFAKAKI